LEHAQKLCLQHGRNLSDFIHKEGSAVGQLKTSHAVSDGAGERALDVTEEFALEEVGVDGGTVNAYERAVSPRAAVVNRRGDQLLAGTGFAQ